ncbi:cadherin-like beta sandwich domain-containing protein [Carboxylicivirga linearis]|uniref:Cadherin-like beta sandwich domain-containing protein n=1 Tax=Carboxylicivirga linearis TaxID=1628157 RepID=A0ABS5JZW6_9BACT|nr:cadherin-like beta sandwich domain-containing protein [Carboxylicivirga linearis]MBS2100403.1 cadherin-like beta sandwich domain-containing protein [Carboxylicivirga linearis]
MKKIYLLFKTVTAMLLTAMIGISGVNAQEWDAPSLVGEQPVSETTYFIYNLGCNGYLNRGANWGTMATVTEKPYANASTAINMWTCVNTSANYWTFQYNNGGSDVNNNYLFAIDGGSIYTDNSSYNTYNISEIDADNHVYRIQVADTAAFYAADQFVGTELVPEETNRGFTNAVRHIRTADDDYINWIFVSQVGYDLYQAKMEMHKYMTYAQMRGDIDLTSYIATYNADVIDDINTAIGELLTALNRTDVTSSITDPGFANGLADWTNDGFVTNDWTTPIGYDRDGILIEKYIDEPGNLAESSITQTLTGLSSGFYAVSFNAHAVKQQGLNPLHTGAFLKCGDDSTEVSAGGKYWVDHVHVTDGELTIGYVLTGDIACNWTALEDFELYYYGANTDASLSGITLSDDNVIIPVFDAETMSYVASIPTGTTSVDVTVTTTDENATTDLTNNTVTVDITDGLGSVDIVVTAEDGTTQETYTVAFKEECFTDMYPGFNLVGDPTVSDLGNFGGWGTQLINTDFDYTYCGATSGKIGPGDAGSIDVNPISFVAEGIYQLKAQVYVEEGTFRIGMDDGSGSETFVTMSTLNQQWETIDTVFQATSGAGDGGLMYFNNWSLSGTTGYIDNWEMYNVTEATLTDIKVDDVSIEGFSPADLTYDYYYAFGTTPTLAVTATAATEGVTPVITNVTELPGTATVEVTGPNGITLTYTINFIEEAIVSDITLSEGVILMPEFDAKTSSYVAGVPAGVTSVDVTVELVDENATTNLSSNPETVAIVDGMGSIEIIVTSADKQTVLTYTIDFKEECFTDMYPGFNLVSDPTISDLGNFGGWGTQSLNTDLDYTYCGVTSGKVGPDGEGSIDVSSINFVGDAIYQLKAMVYVEESEFRIGLTDGSSTNETFVVMSSLNQTWEEIDTLFQANTGAGTGLMYFNNWSLDGTVGYIDNWELYDVTEATLTELTVNETPIADFSPAVLTYDYYYEAGTTPTFEVDATKADANAFMMTVNGSVPGSTTLSLEGVNGIELTYTINFMEDGATNTDKLEESVIKVYPTVSASGEFTVETSGSASVVTVYDLSGKVVSQQNAAAATQKVNVNAKGIYILKVECDGKVEVFKVFNN